MLSSTVRARSSESRLPFCTIFSSETSGSGFSEISATSTSSSSASFGAAVTWAISSSEKGPGPPVPSGTCASLGVLSAVLIFVDLRGRDGVQRLASRLQHDFAGLVLVDAQQPQLAHLQHRQERDDDLLASLLSFEHPEERQQSAFAQPLDDAVDGVRQAHALADDLVLELRCGVLE